MTKWTRQARLQVLEAVIKVESEIYRETTGRSVRTIAAGITKWERVARLLPRKLRGRTWNSREKKYNQFKCSRLFYSLRQGYKRIMGKKVKGFMHLAEEEFLLFKQREGARDTRLAARDDQTVQSESVNTNGAESSDEHYLALETERGEYSLEDASGGSGSLDCHELIPQSESPIDKRMMGHIGYGICEESEASDAEGEAPYWEQEGQDELEDDITNESGSMEGYGLVPQLEGNLEGPADDDSDDSRERSSESRGHAKAAARQSRVAKDALLDGSIRCIDRGFSDLGSWVHSQLIPEARKVAHKMTSSAFSSAKRRRAFHSAQGAATEPFDDLILKNLRGMIDDEVRASFRRLRIRFAEEAKEASVELARELQALVSQVG